MNRSRRPPWLRAMQQGRRQFQRGRFAEAAAAFTRAAEEQPRRVEPWVNLSSALLEAGRFDAAVKAARRALELDPGQGVALLILGDALRARRQAREAESLYLEASRRDPAFTLARVNLATVQIELRRFEQARDTLLQLAAEKLPAAEREEVESALLALSEQARLESALDALAREGDTAALLPLLRATPQAHLRADQRLLDSLRGYADTARPLAERPPQGPPQLPDDWPRIEGLFMVPAIETVDDYLALPADMCEDSHTDESLLESINMEPAIAAARRCHRTMAEPVSAELNLRHWHALACRGVSGLHPGHLKYTRNQTLTNPLVHRAEPTQAAGTLRAFVKEIYPTLPPGLPRALVVWMAVLDIHGFADGNARVGLIWMNRELEWAGQTPLLFSRRAGITGALGEAVNALRRNRDDVTPLLECIGEAQRRSEAFCAELAERRRSAT